MSDPAKNLKLKQHVWVVRTVNGTDSKYDIRSGWVIAWDDDNAYLRSEGFLVEVGEVFVPRENIFETKTEAEVEILDRSVEP